MNGSNSTDVNYMKIAAGIRAGSGALCVLLGSLAIFINVAFKKYTFHLQLMVLYMSVSAVIYGSVTAFNRVDYFLTNTATMSFCAAEGFLSVYSSWTVLMSVFAVTCNVFMEIIERPNSSRCAQCLWLVSIFVLPLLFTWIPFIKMQYGQPPATPWCYFPVSPSSDFGRGVRYGLTFVPYALFIAVQIVMYVSGVVVVLRRRKLFEGTYNPAADGIKKEREKEVILMVLYFGLVFFGYVLAFIAGVVSQYDANVNKFAILALWIMYGSFNPMSVGLTAILITADRKTCNLKSFLSLFGHKRCIAQYPLNVAIDESVAVNPSPKAV